MNETFEVRLTLTRDKPNSMSFEDTYSGLERIWYKFEASADGNVTLWANADGFEHLARFFFKMARSGKSLGYHSHQTAEFGGTPLSKPEVTITLAEPPAGFFGP
jgi:hypothetical protein